MLQFNNLNYIEKINNLYCDEILLLLFLIHFGNIAKQKLFSFIFNDIFNGPNYSANQKKCVLRIC